MEIPDAEVLSIEGKEFCLSDTRKCLSFGNRVWAHFDPEFGEPCADGSAGNQDDFVAERFKLSDGACNLQESGLVEDDVIVASQHASADFDDDAVGVYSLINRPILARRGAVFS